MTSIVEAIAAGERLLAEAGIPAPRLEAEVLLAHRLGMDRSALPARWRDPLPEGMDAAFVDDLDRRASRYPLQYITGRQEFYSLDFEVDERVLIPRPETELIVDEVLKAVRSAGGGATIVDVGTGSGCIAISLAVNIPSAQLLATDISADAIEVAHRNAVKHGVTSRVRFAVGDGLRPAIEAGLAGAADFVLSNPPYIAEGELEGLQAELRHEPPLALCPGRDGLEFTVALIRDAALVVKPGGWLMLELSIGRSREASALLAGGAWQSVEVKPDLQGIPRLLVARRAE